MTPSKEMQEYVLKGFDDSIKYYREVINKYSEEMASSNKRNMQIAIKEIQSHRNEFMKLCESKCTCTPDQTTGSTQFHCCNVCGKIV